MGEIKRPGRFVRQLRRPEVLILLVLAATLIGVFWIIGKNAMDRARYVRTLGGARQIHMATQHMALDRIRTENPLIGWPGDVIGEGDVKLKKASDLARLLVREGYITEGDLSIFSMAPGIPAASRLADLSSENMAYAIGVVEETSKSETLFLVTCNYGPAGLEPGQAPFGSKGWVIFRKGGDGGVYSSRDAQLTPDSEEFQRRIGILPPSWLPGANPLPPPVSQVRPGDWEKTEY